MISSWSRSDVVPQLSVKCRDTVQSLHLSGDLLVCGLQNGEVQVWSLVRKCLDCLAGFHGTAVTAVAVASLSSSPQQIVVLSGSWRQEVKLFSLSDSAQLASVRLRRRLVRRIAVSGQTAAVASCDIEAGRAGEAASSLTLLEITGRGGEVRRELSVGPGLSSLSFYGERLAGGGQGWAAVWRVLRRENYSRQVFNRQDGSTVNTWDLAGAVWVTAILLLEDSKVLVGQGEVRGGWQSAETNVMSAGLGQSLPSRGDLGEESRLPHTYPGAHQLGGGGGGLHLQSDLSLGQAQSPGAAELLHEGGCGSP